MLDHYLLHMTSYNNVQILLANIHDNYLLIVVVGRLVEFFRFILEISSIRLASVFTLMGKGSFIIIRVFTFVLLCFITCFFVSFTFYLNPLDLIYCLNLLLKHPSHLPEVTPLAHIFTATTNKTA